ncbi:MAG: CPBP family intramembrane metalloprotease [Planctomycetes bacterium]|nr:CPBP family intramembrane metalloprotease [Planctomycetota bacterium]
MNFQGKAMRGFAQRLRGFLQTIRDEALRPALRSPAAWTFALLWVISATCLAWTGHTGISLFALGKTFGLVVFMLLTVGLTASASERPAKAQHATRSTRLWLQLALVVAVIALTAQRGMVFHGVTPAMFNHIPLWSPFVQFLEEAGNRLGQAGYLRNPNYLVNPVLMFVVPLPLLLLLGARWRSLGFERGWRTWRVVVLWSIGYVGYWLFNLITGTWSVGRLGHTLLSNTMQNGFFEEFLFRGVLQTRLSRLISPSWGLVLSSLGFGLWHIGVDAKELGGDLLAGAAMSILVQSSMGLALGVIFLRTRNLLACSVIHVVFNTQ